MLHEDDDVRIEYCRRIPAADVVVVTFDPILVGPDRPAYAGAFLRREGADTIAIRKRQEHFYQPLRREEFDAVLGPVLRRYRRRVAYGSSLGGYAALYFCAHGFDMVVASSPRVSAHPRFGIEHWQKQVAFVHEPASVAEPATSAGLIIYDPLDEQDRSLLEQEMLAAWPRAEVLRVPYAGHPANQFLAEIGYIAPCMRSLIAGRPRPPLNRRALKSTSPIYLNELARRSLQHGKPRWAQALARRALNMAPPPPLAVRTLGDAELALGHLDEAEVLLRRFAADNPQDGWVIHSLIQLDRRRAAGAATVDADKPGRRAATAVAGPGRGAPNHASNAPPGGGFADKALRRLRRLLGMGR